MHHFRQSLALLALLPALASAQTWSANLDWQHDGVNVASFRVYAGTNPAALSQVATVSNAASRMTTVPGFPAGVRYFAMTAVSSSSVESLRSSTACAAMGGSGACPALPGQVVNLVVTAVATPAVTVSMIAATEQPSWNEWFLTIVGAGSVRISALGTTRFDWVRQGASPGGSGGTAIATTPTLGGDEDGVLAQAITLNGPINGARADFDGASFTGATVTVNGVAKPLALTGSTWRASFP